MANELYLVTWGELGEHSQVVFCTQAESILRRTYPWLNEDDVNVRCIGVALPGEPTGAICINLRDEHPRCLGAR